MSTNVVKALDSASGSQLTVKPITGVFGAEVSDIDLSRPIDDLLHAQIERLIGEYKVVVFRDQHGVGPAELARFAANFGAVEKTPHPTLPNWPGVPEVKIIQPQSTDVDVEDAWHTDGATRQSTRWLSFLQAIDIPPYGRDTLYADMEAVYDDLSAAMQEFLEGLTVLHSWGYQDPDAPPVAHPMIKQNPVTGRKSVYVNRGYTRSIVGLKPVESEMLLEFLFRKAFLPLYQLRVAWTPGTITVWDNQQTLHSIVRDSRYNRTMHRVMALAS
jgi:taurine dioxygenase